MKSKWSLLSSIFQCVIGLIAVVMFCVLGLRGENVIKWIVTLILSVAFFVLGIIGIVDYKSNK